MVVTKKKKKRKHGSGGGQNNFPPLNSAPTTIVDTQQKGISLSALTPPARPPQPQVQSPKPISTSIPPQSYPPQIIHPGQIAKFDDQK